MSATAVLSAVGTSLWQTALFALLVAVLTLPRFGLPATRRHTLWFVVLASCVVLPFVDFVIPVRSMALPIPALATFAAAPVADSHDGNTLPRGVVGDAPLRSRDANGSTHVSAASTSPIAPPQHAPSRAVAVSVAKPWSWTAIAFTVWALVALVTSIRLVSAFARLRAAKRSIDVSADLTRTASELAGPFRRVRAGISPTLAVPCALGFAHPAVSLPASIVERFDRDDIERVLRHECAHLSRFDDVVKLGQEIVSTLLFFNPVVHLAARTMTIDREIACDDIAATLDPDRVAFAKCLYEMARLTHGRALSPSLGFTGRPSQLGIRIERLLKRGTQSSRTGTALMTSAACVAFVALAAVGSLRLTATAAAPDASNVALDHGGASPAGRSFSQRGATGTGRGPLELAEAPVPSDAPATPGVPNGLRTPAMPSSNKAAIPAVPVIYSAVPASALRDLPNFPTPNISIPHVHVDVRMPNVSGDPHIVVDVPAIRVDAERMNPHVRVTVEPPDDENGDLLDALTAAGYRGLTPADLQELADHDVTGDLLRALSRSGFSRIPADELANLADRGISADRLDALQDSGLHLATVALNGAPVDPSQLIGVADAGVSPEFVKGLARLGYTRVAPDELIEMGDAGVSLGDVRAVVGRHGRNGRPTPETIVNLNTGS